MEWETIKAGLRKLLPVMKVAAAITPNRVDDAAVRFLESLLAADPADVKHLLPK